MESETLCKSAIEEHTGLSIINIVLGLWIGGWSLTFFYDNVCRKKSAKMLQKEAQKDVSAIRRTSLVCLALYTFAFLMYTIANFMDCKHNAHKFFSVGCTMNAMGTLAVLAIFAFRLHFTFNNTVFALSNAVKYYMIFVIVCIFISHCVNTAIDVVGKNTPVSASVGGVTFIFSVLNAFLLLSSYVSKLNNVILHCINQFGCLTAPQLAKLNKSLSIDATLTDFDTISDENGKNANGAASSGVDNKDVDNLRSLTRLISDMSKYTILVAVASVSTFLFSVVLMICVLIIGIEAEAAFMVLFMIDSAVNTTCLVFQFEFYKKRYFVFCGICHKLCETRYTEKANNKNKKAAYKLKRLESGEIGIVQADVLATEPDMATIGQSNNNASLSIPATAGAGNDAQGNNDQMKDAVIGSNDVTLVAQKSADLQLSSE